MLSVISEMAVVLGGRTGFGLAKVINLVSEGYFVEIQDREESEEGQKSTGSYDYHFCDLIYSNEDCFSSLAEDVSVERNIA